MPKDGWRSANNRARYGALRSDGADRQQQQDEEETARYLAEHGQQPAKPFWAKRRHRRKKGGHR